MSKAFYPTENEGSMYHYSFIQYLESHVSFFFKLIGYALKTYDNLS